MAKKCNHKKCFEIRGKASDRFSWSYNDGDWSEPDYAPEIEGLCGGNNFHIKICVDCHIVVGFAAEDVEALVVQTEEIDEGLKKKRKSGSSYDDSYDYDDFDDDSFDDDF